MCETEANFVSKVSETERPGTLVLVELKAPGASVRSLISMLNKPNNLRMRLYHLDCCLKGADPFKPGCKTGSYLND